MKKQGHIERIVGETALKMLRWAGLQAQKREDPHEAIHCFQAVLVGNSLHTHFRCAMREIDQLIDDVWKDDVTKETEDTHPTRPLAERQGPNREPPADLFRD